MVNAIWSADLIFAVWTFNIMSRRIFGNGIVTAKLRGDTVGLFALRILSETPPPKYVRFPRSLFHDGGGGSPPSTTPSLARERGILLTPLLHD